MITTDIILQFVAISALLGLAPGPDNLFVLVQSAIGGSQKGVMVTLGLCTGLLVHTSAVAIGIAAFFQKSATAFGVLKLVGASYLLYLAYMAFRDSSVRSNTEPVVAKSDAPLRALYMRGILMNVTNPKVVVFFLAFLPQFVKAGAVPASLQILQLGVLFIATSVVIFVGIALAAGRLGEWLKRSPRAMPAMNKLAGAIFVGLAVKLATTAHWRIGS